MSDYVKNAGEEARDERRRLATGERRIEVARLASQGHKPGAIAEMLGVHRATVHEDLRNPMVKEQLQVMRTAGLEALADVAREAADDALKTLREAMTEADPAIRVRASQSILQALAPLIAHGDFNARLARLEEATAGGTEGGDPPGDGQTVR